MILTNQINILIIVPGEFVSELDVKVYYSEEGDVGIVELMFQV